jgi:hypothetical protein
LQTIDLMAQCLEKGQASIIGLVDRSAGLYGRMEAKLRDVAKNMRSTASRVGTRRDQLAAAYRTRFLGPAVVSMVEAIVGAIKEFNKMADDDLDAMIMEATEGLERHDANMSRKVAGMVVKHINRQLADVDKVLDLF